jgi:hypothetical protein
MDDRPNVWSSLMHQPQLFLIAQDPCSPKRLFA